MSVRFSKLLPVAILAAGAVLVSAPAFATVVAPVPEPSTLALLGSAIAIPGVAAWIKRKLS